MNCCGLTSTGLQDIEANNITSDNITIYSNLNVSGITNLYNSLNVSGTTNMWCDKIRTIQCSFCIVCIVVKCMTCKESKF